MTPQQPPRRCDQALVDALAEAGHEITRARLAHAFEAGDVAHADTGAPLRPGKRIEAPLRVEVRLTPPPSLSAEPQDLPLSVLYEDADLLVVDKAAGMVVHPSAGHPDGTLVNAVLHHLGLGASDLPVLAGNDPTRPGIVHRIDRDTSGVLVIAKHVRAQTHLAAQFSAHTLTRRYVAVLTGVPAWTEREVETGHARDPADRRRFAPSPDAPRRARSHFSVTETLDGAVVADVTLSTGRTHQIRMHARHLGHPIVADPLYGPARAPRGRLGEAAAKLGRHALHAALLSLRHPADDRLVSWSCPPPADMRALIDALG